VNVRKNQERKKEKAVPEHRKNDEWEVAGRLKP